MSIQQWSDEILLVDLTGEPAFSEEMMALQDKLDKLHAADRSHVVLDLSRVRTLNSTNLAQLLRVRKVLSEHGHKLRICSVQDTVWTVFLVTGLDKIFQFRPDVPSALAGLQLEAGMGD